MCKLQCSMSRCVVGGWPYMHDIVFENDFREKIVFTLPFDEKSSSFSIVKKVSKAITLYLDRKCINLNIELHSSTFSDGLYRFWLKLIDTASLATLDICHTKLGFCYKHYGQCICAKLKKTKIKSFFRFYRLL